MIMLLVPVAGAGVAPYLLKVFGSEGWLAVRWLRPSLKLLGTSVGLAAVSLSVWAALGPHEAETRFLLLFLSLHLVGQVALEVASSKFQLEERYQTLAVWQLLPHVIRFFLVVLVYLVAQPFMSAKVVGGIYAITAVVLLALSLKTYQAMYGGNFGLKGHYHRQPEGGNDIGHAPLSIGSVISNSWPFGLASLAYIVYFQSDIVILKYFADDVSVGIYNVAFAVMTAVYLLPSVVYQKYLLPKIHRWSNQDPAKMRRVYMFGNKLMLLLGTSVGLGVYFLSDWGVVLFFGEEYGMAAGYLQTLAVSVPAMFVAFNTGAVLVTKEHMKMKVKIMAAVALLNLALNFYFIPSYGAAAAAASTVVCQFALAGLYFLCSEKRVFGERYQPGLKER